MPPPGTVPGGLMVVPSFRHEPGRLPLAVVRVTRARERRIDRVFMLLIVDISLLACCDIEEDGKTELYTSLCSLTTQSRGLGW